MLDTLPSETIQHGSGKNKTVLIIIILFIVAAALVFGFMVFRSPEKKEEPEVVVIDEKKEPTPTEKPKIDKESVKIQVQNGTGTPGQAAAAVEALKKAGFNADNIKATNADNYDHAATTVAFQAGFEEIAVDIRKALESTFDKVDVESSKLDDKSEFNIVVTTGGKKFEEEKPTAKPTLSPTKSSTSPTPSSKTTITATPSLTLSPTSSPTPTP